MSRAPASAVPGGGPRTRRVARALAVRPGEGQAAALVALAFSALEAGRGLGEVGVDAVVLNAFGVRIFPALYVTLGVTGIVATLILAAFLGPERGVRVAVALPLGLAGLLVVGRLAARGGGPELLLPLWVTVWLGGLLLLTLLWAVTTRIFDARQAKRLFPLCTSAAIGGSFVGLLLAGPAARLLGTANLVLLEAGLFAVVAAALARLGRRTPRSPSAPVPTVSVIRTGATYVARTPLMRLVAAAYLLFAVLLFALTYPFNAVMAETFEGDPAALASALGLVAATATGMSFLVSTFVAKRLYVRFGVATIALVLPAVYVGGFAVWLLAFGLPTAVGVRIVQQVVQRGVSNSAWSAIFSAVPRARRGPVLAFMDAVPGHLGTILSGVLLALATSLPLALGMTPVFVLGIAVAVACLVVVIGVRRRYAATVLATIRDGLAEQVLEGGPGLGALTADRQVVAGLLAATSSPRSPERRLAAELLGRARPAGAVPALVALLDDAAPEVRLAAVAALADLDHAPEGLRPLLGDPDPRVRCAAVAGLARSGFGDIGRLAEDPDPRVRAEVAVALAAAGSQSEARSAVEHLLAADDAASRAAGLDALARTSLGDDAASFAAILATALEDDDAGVRAAAGRVLRVVPWGAEVALAALRGTSNGAQIQALDALDGTDPDVRATVIAWATSEVKRAARYRREAIVLARTAEDPAPYVPLSPRSAVPAVPAVSGAVGGSRGSAAFLAAILARRVEGIVDRSLRAVAVLGAPEATGPIRRALRSADLETRAHALEALDAVGDARLARALVGLLDSEPDAAPAPAGLVADVVRPLVDDADPWVRALALRTLVDDLADAERAVRLRAASDPSAAVAIALAAVDQGEDAMQDSSPALDLLDRMLLLRRVPLFAALEPEDLQRLATVATERVYAGGEDLVVEGEVGDELVVVVEGTVQVLQQGDSGERVLREVGEGEHVGELAVLRRRPRTATVRASDPAARTLVIGGEAVTAVLRERPDAAMAMLATLADRISRQ